MSRNYMIWVDSPLLSTAVQRVGLQRDPFYFQSGKAGCYVHNAAILTAMLFRFLLRSHGCCISFRQLVWNELVRSILRKKTSSYSVNFLMRITIAMVAITSNHASF